MKLSKPHRSNKNLRIIFAGTPDFAATALMHLLTENCHILAVYTQPDRPAGRGQKLVQSPVKKLATERKLPVYQPVNFKNSQEVGQLTRLNPDVMVVAAYGLILPASVLAVPTYGCLNIHASLLPRWRGAAPIQRAIQAGDRETGITIMQMEEGLDTGPVLLTQATPIKEEDTSSSLHDRLAEIGGKTIVAAIKQLHELRPSPQDNSCATYAHRLSKVEGNIDWTTPAEQIIRTLRAFTPWPGCFSRMGEVTIKIHHAELAETGNEEDEDKLKSMEPGTILARSTKGIRVACGESELNISRLQLPGAKAMNATDFINGNQQLLIPGQRFSNDAD